MTVVPDDAFLDVLTTAPLPPTCPSSGVEVMVSRLRHRVVGDRLIAASEYGMLLGEDRVLYRSATAADPGQGHWVVGHRDEVSWVEHGADFRAAVELDDNDKVVLVPTWLGQAAEAPRVRWTGARWEVVD